MVWVFCLNDYFSGFSYFFDVGLQNEISGEESFNV